MALTTERGHVVSLATLLKGETHSLLAVHINLFITRFVITLFWI